MLEGSVINSFVVANFALHKGVSGFPFLSFFFCYFQCAYLLVCNQPPVVLLRRVLILRRPAAGEYSPANIDWFGIVAAKRRRGVSAAVLRWIQTGGRVTAV